MLLMAGFTAGCAGNGGGTGAPTRVRIQPGDVTVQAGEKVSFTAFLDGGIAPVVWTVVGGDANGTITSEGQYTAPATAGAYQVRVAVQSNPNLNATANVQVTTGLSVQITSPTTVPLTIPRSTIDFDATVTGGSSPVLAWTVDGNASVDSQGVFRAQAPGTYTVTARSVEDPSKTDTIQVVVVANVNVRLVVENRGDVLLRLATAEAPNTTANFVSLVNKGFYDGIIFHRYEPGFVIQGGDPLTKTLPLDHPDIGTGGPGYTIPFEENSLLHEKFALAMARSASRDSGGSQFYITLEAQPSLDGDYVVFGKAIGNTDVVLALRRGDKILSARTEAP